MSRNSAAEETMTSVAVAVNGVVGSGSGNGSKRAVRWAVDNLLPKADRFILVHVIPTITSVPTPSGDHMPIAELDENVVKMYVEEVKLKFAEIFLPFKKLCKTQKMEILVLEDESPATALIRYISESRIRSFVMGSCSINCIIRKMTGPGVPKTVLRCAPDTCDIHIVSRHRIISKSANPPSSYGTSSGHWMFAQRDYEKGSCGTNKPLKHKYDQSIGASSISELSDPHSHVSTHTGISTNAIADRVNCQNFGDNFDTITIKRCNSMASTKIEESDVMAEMEQLRLELQNTVAMYKRTCEELVHAQNKVQLLSSECLEEARRVNNAHEREEYLRKIAAEERAKYLQSMKEIEEAKSMLANEVYEKQIAELNALKEFIEKQKIANALLLNDRRYIRYTSDEIAVATDFFSESNVIGEGGYGKVYKCSLHHTPVAVKVLQPDALEKKQEFLKEVEVLSQLRHPHIISLLGACPESGCLVYEYLENGSLEDYIFHRNGKPPLPWFVRFRIVFEVACGLAFLHNSKPEPIVHRDLKPANILLDRNYISKIGDVGLAKFITDVVPDNISEYRNSILVGTLYYMDPEYQRTGTVRPKSDLYAFGLITLQLLTARRPHGLLHVIENAIKNGSLSDILDESISDWPARETEELARIALKCSKLKCRERPDLETEVMPVLERLVYVTVAKAKVERNNIYPPSHYFCPILQEIMDDPYIAADGFTYEHRAIKAWLDKHKLSPVTKTKLQDSLLIPNHTLRSAIQEWKSLAMFSST
ncbi:Pkinase domain-containing protein/Usp domain-containing protein/U-box domain-containing protein [Cephalotus follicularis]|uniref:RING-type E3 ubiquitin transferase n=1 Tax=Cephalotus follicularis TaxID=3775 RepID=A0A1Q3BY95_CEPFO|nr:Pkinase domain-containing protein/Usp domain-containing protein/U-box domain-containing protein [Cephalotus follicularis]